MSFRHDGASLSVSWHAMMNTLIAIFLIAWLVTLVQKPGWWGHHVSHLLITLWQTYEGQHLPVNIAYRRRTTAMYLWACYLHKKSERLHIFFWDAQNYAYRMVEAILKS